MQANNIYKGDCLELMKDIETGSIDMILCDLPYGTTACKWDTVIPFGKLWEQYNRVIKDNGAIVLFGSEPFASTLRTSNLKMYRYDWVWDKRYPANYPLAKKQPLKRHENICVFSKKTHNYYPQMKKRDKPIRKGANKGARVFNEGLSKQEYIGKVYTHSYPTTIQTYPTRKEGKAIHPTQKPVALLEYLIKTYSNEGELVLDNCAGSGSTGVACQNLKRKYILMEKEGKYYDIAKERLSENDKRLKEQLF